MAFRPHIGIFNLSPWKIGEWHFGSDAAAMKTSLPDQLIGRKEWTEERREKVNKTWLVGSSFEDVEMNFTSDIGKI